uniref:Stress-response A/B barrel domain-containing protein n=1 Tax=Fagus sylvatica TaxID=28930 RepID=A0A2N9I675_FAGSY
MASGSEAIEHIVLFKVKDETDPSKVTAWLDALNGLNSLDQVSHLSAGPILRTQNSSFTHILHSRYNSKHDLAAYSLHPRHVTVVKEQGQPIVEDILAVDWVAPDLDRIPLIPGSAIRVSLLKLKENEGDDVKSEILGVIKGIKEVLGGISEFNYGENFSPGRNKGYSLAWLAVFPGRRELEEAVASNEELRNFKEKVRAFVESEVVVDYVVPPPQSAIA